LIAADRRCIGSGRKERLPFRDPQSIWSLVETPIRSLRRVHLDTPQIVSVRNTFDTRSRRGSPFLKHLQTHTSLNAVRKRFCFSYSSRKYHLPSNCSRPTIGDVPHLFNASRLAQAPKITFHPQHEILIFLYLNISKGRTGYVQVISNRGTVPQVPDPSEQCKAGSCG